MGADKRFRRLAVPILVVLLLLASGSRLVADSSQGIRLTWALLLRSPDGGAKPLDCAREFIHLKSGDRIRIFLRLQSACYFYVYLYDAQKNLFLLFPDAFSSWSSPAAADATFLLPDRDRWYHLDENGGTEIIYLILSEKRLKSLESVTDRDGEKAARRGSFRGIPRPFAALQEIRRLIAVAAVTPVKEKPVPVAADFRGLRDEGELDGMSVEAGGIYVRTIRLDH